MTTLPVGGFRIWNVNFRQRSDSRTHDYTTTTSGGGFRIRNVNFRERSDGRSHEHYHSVGLVQAHPN